MGRPERGGPSPWTSVPNDGVSCKQVGTISSQREGQGRGGFAPHVGVQPVTKRKVSRTCAWDSLLAPYTCRLEQGDDDSYCDEIHKSDPQVKTACR